MGEDEAAQFACNAVVVGETVILGSGCPRLRQQLDAVGFATHETPLSEFVKAGGSAKCLTLRLDGEDAATWTLPQPRGVLAVDATPSAASENFQPL